VAIAKATILLKQNKMSLRAATLYVSLSDAPFVSFLP